MKLWCFACTLFLLNILPGSEVFASKKIDMQTLHSEKEKIAFELSKTIEKMPNTRAKTALSQ